jgi:hypothetical protein
MNIETVGIKKITRPTTGRPTTAKIGGNSNAIYHPPMQVTDGSMKEIDEETFNLKNENTSLLNENENEIIPGNTNLKNSINSTNNNNINNETEDHKAELEKMINEENHRIEFINNQKEKLKNIQLIEKNIDGMYEWKSLFNKSRPITAYTHTQAKFNYYDAGDESNINLDLNNLNKSSNAITNENLFTAVNTVTKTKKQIEQPFIFPIALIDEKQEKLQEYITIPKNISAKRKKMENALKNINKYSNRTKSNIKSTNVTNIKEEPLGVSSRSFYKNKNNSKNSLTGFNFSTSNSKGNIFTNKGGVQSNTARSNAARPQSVFAERGENEIFYMNKAFSDYFTQDFFEFVEKFPLLHPKIKCEKKALLKALNAVKQKNIEYEKIKENIQENELNFDKKNLNLAGNSKNIIPLMKSIYKQIFPEAMEEPMPSNKVFMNSNKPLGNSSDNVDYKINIRNKNMHQFYQIKNRANSLSDIMNNRLNPETYDCNDPQILKMFEEKKGETIPIEEMIEKITSSNIEKEDIYENYNSTKEQGINTKSLNTSRPKTALKQINKKIQSAKLKNSTSGSLFRNENKIQTAKSRERSISPYRSEEQIVEIDEFNYIFSEEMLEAAKKSENIPLLTKSLPFKEKPSKNPRAYQIMKNNLNKNTQSSDFRYPRRIFNDALHIQNIQSEIVEENLKIKSVKFIKDQMTDMDDDYKIRPSTSLNQKFGKTQFSRIMSSSRGGNIFNIINIIRREPSGILPSYYRKNENNNN